MEQNRISDAELSILEKIYKLWAKLYKSKSKEDSLKALELSQAICSALPRLLNEIKQYRVNNE
tara:strand:+ start:303 stop:491 length:189 start_codon:yes stop_codon:yes gene_type:complete